MSQGGASLSSQSSPKRSPFLLSWEGKQPPEITHNIEPLLSLSTLKKLGGAVIEGDNHLVVQSLRKSFSGKVALIYADPPYGVGTFFHAGRGRQRSERHERAYYDGQGVGEVQALYELITHFHRLLSSRGTLWMQCDWRRSAIIRLLLDEVFGPENFINHIIWSYKTGGAATGDRFARKHDDILVYGRSSAARINPSKQKSYVPTLPEPHTPSGKRLGVKRDRACELCGVGTPGQKFRWVIGRDVWDDIPALFRNDSEIVGYPTQKPVGLLKKIIAAGTKRGDVVLDLFGGSGTTAVAATELGRRWILADRSAVAIRTINKRLQGLNINPIKIAVKNKRG